jgi:hypothetical protein
LKSTPSPQDQAIIDLLKRLEPLKEEYPPELLAARRAAFVAQVEQRKADGAKEELLSKQQTIELLEGLKPVVVEYPPDLFAARRAAFLAQVEQYNEVEEELASEDPVIQLLESLKPIRAQYPPELLAARRTAFIAQVQQQNKQAVPELLPAQYGRIGTLLARLKSIEIQYPRKLLTSRRTAFMAQIHDGRVSILEALHVVFQSLFKRKAQVSLTPAMRSMRTALVVASFVFAAFVGSLFYGNKTQLSQVPNPSASQNAGNLPFAAAATSTQEVARVICKPGYLPPLCLAKEFDKSRDLAGNGTARPAVAKDTIPGYSRIHNSSYVNDGLYGPGASWISNSAYSWIKLDLGRETTINTITFGRDRLGNLNDGDPGQFVIAVALADNIYADGNSTNDFMEYTQVYNSEYSGFDGVVSGAETIQANFNPTKARFVKITFENAGTAIDEVEVFMIQPHEFAGNPTHRPRDTVPAPTFTPVPTDTLIPSATPTDVPTNTPRPTLTPTDVPTNTPRPSLTPTDEPTNTPRPSRTPTDVPTNTPRPSNTPTDEPTNTSQPTDTPQPPPTDTPEPFLLPTDTPMPLDGP